MCRCRLRHVVASTFIAAVAGVAGCSSGQDPVAAPFSTAASTTEIPTTSSSIEEPISVEADLGRYAVFPEPWLLQCAAGEYGDASQSMLADGASGEVDLVEAVLPWLSQSDRARLRKLSHREIDASEFTPEVHGSNPGVRAFDVLLIDGESRPFAQLRVEQMSGDGFLATLFVTCRPTA